MGFEPPTHVISSVLYQLSQSATSPFIPTSAVFYLKYLIEIVKIGQRWTKL